MYISFLLFLSPEVGRQTVLDRFNFLTLIIIFSMLWVSLKQKTKNLTRVVIVFLFRKRNNKNICIYICVCCVEQFVKTFVFLVFFLHVSFMCKSNTNKVRNKENLLTTIKEKQIFVLVNFDRLHSLIFVTSIITWSKRNEEKIYLYFVLVVYYDYFWR
jgi:hypothetical protein